MPFAAAAAAAALRLTWFPQGKAYYVHSGPGCMQPSQLTAYGNRTVNGTRIELNGIELNGMEQPRPADTCSTLPAVQQAIQQAVQTLQRQNLAHQAHLHTKNAFPLISLFVHQVAAAITMVFTIATITYILQQI
jgi:hypothetical protein